jgi:hypothetical protein
VRDGDLLGELLMEAEGRAMSDDDILYATSQPFSLTSCAGCFEHCALTLTVTLRLCPVPATASCRSEAACTRPYMQSGALGSRP